MAISIDASKIKKYYDTSKKEWVDQKPVVEIKDVEENIKNMIKK
jgi:hypothetical protein